jgi:hypothetical protein
VGWLLFPLDNLIKPPDIHPPKINPQNHTKSTTMPLPKRAVIVCTSASAPLHGRHTTGLFVGEALEPFDVFVKAGFEVDLVSEKGTYVADWLSLQPDFLSGEYLKQWEDKGSDFRKKLDNMPDAKTIKGENVSAEEESVDGLC